MSNPFRRAFVCSTALEVGEVPDNGATCVIPGKAYSVKDLVRRAASGQLPPINLYDTYDDEGDLNIDKELDLRDPDNDLSDLKNNLDSISHTELQKGQQAITENPTLIDNNQFAAGLSAE